MRVANENKPERFIRCPWCNTRLAFTEDDIKECVRLSFVERYVECCVCGHEVSLGCDVIHFE